MSSPYPHHKTNFTDPATMGGSVYPLMLDAIADAICMFDQYGQLTWQNKSCLSLCHRANENKPAAVSLTDHMTEEQQSGFRERLTVALSGEKAYFEWVCPNKTRGFLMELRPLRDQQAIIGVMGTVRDNTGLSASAALSPAEGINRVFERVTDAFIALDQNWNYTFLNSTAAELHGRPANELIGKNIWKEFPDVVDEPFYHSLDEAMRTQQPLRVELYYSRGKKWFEDFIYPSPEGVSVYYRDITAQKNMEELLIKSEQRYRSLVEQAGDAIIIADLQGQCQDVNPMAEKLTGYSREELTGLNLFQLLVLPPGEPPIRIPEVMAYLPVMQERKVRRKDGSCFYAELNTKLLSDDRILVIGRDISERKKMEDEILESEFRYRTLFEEGADGVCFYDVEKGCYLSVNKRMTELFGYSEQEFLQLKITDILFPEDLLENPPRYLGLDKGITVTNERYFRKKDGSGIYIESTTRRLTGTSFVSFMRDITDRKNAENSIRENELRWKLALDKSELGVWEMNFEKKTAFISQKTREQTGFLSERDLATPDFWLNAIYKADQEAVVGKFINSLKGKEPSFDATFRVVCKSGELKWFRFTGNVTGRDSRGLARRIIGVHEDITKRVLNEKELRLKEAAIESTISGIGMADMEGTITYVNQASVRMWGARDSQELVGKKLADVFYGDGFLRSMEVLQTRGYISGEDTAMRTDGTLFPVEFVAHVIRDEAGEPICLYGSFLDISSRKQAQAKLAESETLFREITQHSPSGIVLLGKELTFKFVSDSARRITGYLDDNIVGVNPAAFTHPDDLPGLQLTLEELLQEPGKVVTAQYRFLYKDNSWHYLESTFSNLLHIKNVEVISINFRDIHEERMARILLQESEDKLRSFFEQSLDGIMLGSEEGDIEAANQAAQVMLNLTEAEIKQRGLDRLVDTADRSWAEHQLVRKEKGFAASAVFLIRKDGTRFPAHLSSSVFTDTGGKKLFSLSFHDITEQKKIEAQIRQFNERFQLLSKATNDAVWEWDLVNDSTWWNEAFYNMMGYDPSLPVPDLEDWSLKIHPDDRKKVTKRIRRARRNELDSWQDEFRYRLPDGSWGTVLDRAYLIRNEEGQPVRVIGAFVDITQQKLIEEKLQFEKMLSDSLIQKMPGLFYLYTKEGKFIRWNKNFETITGYSAREIRHMHPLDFYEGDEKEKVRTRIGHIFRETLPGTEVELVTKNKKKIPIYINSMALIYEGLPCVVGMGADITQLKRTQQELVESELAFQRLFHESTEAILLLDGRNFIDCNNATVSLLGYSSREEFMNQPPWKLSPRKQPDGAYSYEKAKRMIREALEKGYNRFEWLHRKADGTVFPVEVMLTPILIKGKQLFYTIWHDISAQKKAEEALQQSIKEISAYKYAIDQATIVSFADFNGNITYVNDNFQKLYGYSKEEIIGVNHRVLNSGQHPKSFWQQFWKTIKSGKVLKADVSNKAKDGSIHWAGTTIVPFLNEKGKPYQFLAIRNDITEKRKLEEDLNERQRLEQVLITETALDAQEKERNFLGQELHDNVNQILVGTKMILSVVAEDPEKHKEVLNSSILNIQHAIEENRKLSHSLATPDLKLMSLPKQLTSLAHEMFHQQHIKVSFSRKGFREDLLDDKKKIALYRIAQEQCTNIIKYAQATRVDIRLQVKKDKVQLWIRDNGKGMESGKSTDGIGIRNMKGRLSIYGGRLDIETSPGNGFTLCAEIPL
ncbi:MAG: PAS domain S-box protein [Sphingobacteriales bacterium]|nr:PAS domain S-box protein [Sphingobacteriales bacterium]